MPKVIGLMLICCLWGANLAAETAEEFIDYLDGEDTFQKFNSIGYIYGLRDGITEMQDAYVLMNPTNEPFYCIPEDKVILHFEIVERMREEIIADKSLMSEPPMWIFFKAMIRGYPCD